LTKKYYFYFRYLKSQHAKHTKHLDLSNVYFKVYLMMVQLQLHQADQTIS